MCCQSRGASHHDMLDAMPSTGVSVCMRMYVLCVCVSARLRAQEYVHRCLRAHKCACLSACVCVFAFGYMHS